MEKWIVLAAIISLSNNSYANYVPASEVRKTADDNSFMGANCDVHRIFCQIVRNHLIAGAHKLNKKKMMNLSNAIYKISKKYDIDAEIFTAILAQESLYKLGTKNCHKGLTSSRGIVVEGEVCSDFGISQIHYKTIERYDFDLGRLTTDLDYSLEAGAVVLRDFKLRYSKRESDWWTRYNASTASLRDKYKERVERYL